MDKPKLVHRPPGLRMMGAGHGIYDFPYGINLSEWTKKFSFRWFKRSVHYYEHNETKERIYPDWYIKEQKV